MIKIYDIKLHYYVRHLGKWPSIGRIHFLVLHLSNVTKVTGSHFSAKYKDFGFPGSIAYTCCITQVNESKSYERAVGTAYIG